MVAHDDQYDNTLPRAEVIARLNDRLRVHGEGGISVVTAGVRCLRHFNAHALMVSLANYASFDVDNDPHGERDFGDLKLWETDLLWKIDYYDLKVEFSSDDPANADATTRVLTVMLASEY